MRTSKLAIIVLGMPLLAEDAVRAGRLIVDPPTLENVGLRWYIEGDDNRNATVSMEYRRSGESRWREAQPLLRVHREVVNRDFQPYTTGNVFAGSIFSLQPETNYDVRLVLRDPDGGNELRTRRVRIGKEPERPAGRAIEVSSVAQLRRAYDTSKPGAVIVVREGRYRFEEPWVMTKSRVALIGNGEAIFEGGDHKTDLLHVEHTTGLYLEGLTFRHARMAIFGGKKNGPGARDLVVRRCRVDDVIYGINTYSENSSGWRILDNELVGTNSTWYPRPQNYMSPSHTGVNVYGQGNVVAYNRITRFSDGIALANFGPPVEDIERQPVSNDYHNNDISWAQDDCIETDYGAHNIRVYKNRCVNAHTGLSVQPFYGGPVYLIRNEVAGVTALPFKWHNYCTGILAFHNTLLCARSGFMSFDKWQNGHLRNNLILGGADEEGRHAYALQTGTLTSYSTLDYDGYRRNGHGPMVRWFDGTVRKEYDTIEDFSRATGHERHGKMVDYDIFVRASPPRTGVTTAVEQYDLGLREGAAAVDAGAPLANINDDARGRGPDLGAHELGAPKPWYGPRKGR